MQPAQVALLASVFIVAACGLVYELAAGTLASYLLGDSILQFSTVIGTYLFAMGVGSYLSRFFEPQLVARFLRIELLVGVPGLRSSAALSALAAPQRRAHFAHTDLSGCSVFEQAVFHGVRAGKAARSA